MDLVLGERGPTGLEYGRFVVTRTECGPACRIAVNPGPELATEKGDDDDSLDFLAELEGDRQRLDDALRDLDRDHEDLGV